MDERTPTPVPNGAVPDRPVWRAGARWLLGHPLQVAGAVALAYGFAHAIGVLPWNAEQGTVVLVVLALYGLAVVAWKWIEEERGVAAERRSRRAD